MRLVIFPDLVATHLDGCVHSIIRNHHEVNVRRVVVLCDGSSEHQRILEVAVGEQRTILRIELLRVDSVLNVVPVLLQSAGLILRDVVDEILESILGEIAALIHKSRIL